MLMKIMFSVHLFLYLLVSSFIMYLFYPIVQKLERLSSADMISNQELIIPERANDLFMI